MTAVSQVNADNQVTIEATDYGTTYQYYVEAVNANTISCGTEEPVVLCSETGDISIQSTTFRGNGLIYAPNGTVTIQVSDFQYTGTIIAKKIKLQMTTCQMDQE